jgi:hypothetical protein
MGCGFASVPIHQDRTRAALTQAATEFRSPQMQFVAEHIEQRGLRIDIDRLYPAVDF